MPQEARVAVIYGSPTDHDVMAQAGGLLERFGVPYESTFISPHRSPRTLADWIAELEPSGVEVVIAGGGGQTASLPGIIAAHVTMPVIGVPLRTGSLIGIDALTMMTEMSTGVPVAVVGPRQRQERRRARRTDPRRRRPRPAGPDGHVQGRVRGSLRRSLGTELLTLSTRSMAV